MKKIRRTMFPALFAVSMMWVGLSQAGQINLNLSGSANATKDGKGQVLLKFNLPAELQGAQIDLATLQVSLSSESSRVAVLLYPLTGDWNSSTEVLINPEVSRTDSLSVGRLVELKSGNPASLNVTELVQAWSEGALANRGFVLIPSKAVADFRLGGGTTRLTIFYTPPQKE